MVCSIDRLFTVTLLCMIKKNQLTVVTEINDDFPLPLNLGFVTENLGGVILSCVGYLQQLCVAGYDYKAVFKSM